MQLVKKILIAMLLIMIAISLVLPAAAAAATTPTVTPPNGPAGTTFTFRAQFEPEEGIGVWFTAPDGSVVEYGTIDSDKDGVAEFAWTAPADALAGTWRATARPLISLERQVVFTFALTSGSTAPTNTNSVTPASGAPGTTFTFRTSNLEPGEVADFWLTTPTGDSVGAPNQPVFADANGNAQWTWTAPQNAQSGEWLMVIRGRASRSDQVIRFVISNAPAAPAPAAPAAQVTPASGKPGTTFRFQLSGFFPGERVGYWFSSPDGRAVGNASFVTNATDTGDLIVTWTAPTDAQIGPWLFASGGQDSRVTKSVRFEIVP